MAVLKRAQTEYTGSGTSIVMTKPTGTAEGDLLVMFIVESGSTPDLITPPSGFDRIWGEEDEDLGGGAWIAGYFKTATSSEPSSYTFSVDNSGTHKGFMVGYYDDAGVSGYWSFKGSGITEDRTTSLTSVPLLGPGLYITGFLSDDNDSVVSNDSPVSSLWFNNSNSFAFQVYGGVTTGTVNDTTVGWSNTADDKYSLSILAEFVQGTPTVPSDITYRASTSLTETYVSGLSGETENLSKPTGVSEGDIMFMSIARNGSGGTILATPTGWTVLYDSNNVENQGSSTCATYYKIAGASEPSTYTVSVLFFDPAGGGGSTFNYVIDAFYTTNGVASWTLYSKSYFGRNAESEFTDLETLTIGGVGLLYATINVNDYVAYTDDSPVTQRTEYIGAGDSTKGMHLTYGGGFASGSVRVKVSNPTEKSTLIAAVFESTSTPPAGGSLFKIKIGSTAVTAVYKDIEAMHVATSSAWKEVLSAHIAVDDNAGGKVWKELKI